MLPDGTLGNTTRLYWRGAGRITRKRHEMRGFQQLKDYLRLFAARYESDRAFCGVVRTVVRKEVFIREARYIFFRSENVPSSRLITPKKGSDLLKCRARQIILGRVYLT